MFPKSNSSIIEEINKVIESKNSVRNQETKK